MSEHASYQTAHRRTVVIPANATTMPESPVYEPGSPVDYKRLVTRWTTEVWNDRREDVIDEMMAPECLVEVEGLDAPLTRSDFKERVLKKLGIRRRQDVAAALGKIPGSVLDRHGADRAAVISG
jgi:hypothetical protein